MHRILHRSLFFNPILDFIEKKFTRGQWLDLLVTRDIRVYSAVQLFIVKKFGREQSLCFWYQRCVGAVSGQTKARQVDATPVGATTAVERFQCFLPIRFGTCMIDAYSSVLSVYQPTNHGSL